MLGEGINLAKKSAQVAQLKVSAAGAKNYLIKYNAQFINAIILVHSTSANIIKTYLLLPAKNSRRTYS
jgi:hypothetical protein